MHLVIENTKKSFPFPENNVILVGNDFECDVQINHPKIWGRHFSITQYTYGCVLEVFDQSVVVNDVVINEKCLLDAGDLIVVDDFPFRLIDNEYIPKDSSLNHTNVSIDTAKNESSVFGLRSFASDDAGFFIIDNFHHVDGWHVIRKDDELHFIDNKNVTKLNGLGIAQAILSNGDVISAEGYKYKVELPGTSGFSKFSPSHPRNVQLSESMNLEESKDQAMTSPKNSHFFKNNLWWLTLASGLVILLVVVILNQQS